MTRSRLAGLLAFAIGGVCAAQVPAPTERVPTPPPAYCPGEYADDFSALARNVRELEQKTPAYTFCVRTVATYECPFYGADGSLHRKKRRVVAHGTGFAYRQQGGDTLLLTNDHVAEWPAVTDADHPVDDVASGCKRVADALSIVDNDSDSYERDDIPLTRVVVDPQLDVAVLKAHAQLPILPWKLGHSAGLKERNIVDIRGFPLGVFKATNVGKVISAYDHDSYKDWDHDDFVVDALLSSGNSGSPVFAISCKTGEFELVGIHHAGYTRGSALNVVIGIDQVRDLMNTLKRVSRTRVEPTLSLDGASRARLVGQSAAAIEPYFPLGSLTATLHSRADGAIFFEVLNRDFPFRAYPLLVLEDLRAAGPDDFGAPGRVWLGSRQGLKPYPRSELDAESLSQLAKVLEALRRASVTSFALRAADQDASSTREKYERSERLENVLQKFGTTYAELAQGTVELAERLGPQSGEPALDLRAVLLLPAPEAPVPDKRLNPVQQASIEQPAPRAAP